MSLILMPASSWALSAYSQDFEALSQSEFDALGNDGWLFFVNVFDGDSGEFLEGYGGVAPNWALSVSAIALGEGGADQGLQQLLAYSDYLNQGAHGAGDLLETNVYQEQVIDVSDVGTTWTFTFDAKRGDIAGESTAAAFIKTFDQEADFALTNFLVSDTTNLDDTWSSGSVSIFIDQELAGQVLQFGVLSNATNNQLSGNFYDNISFSQTSFAFGGVVLGINAQYAGCANLTDPQASFVRLPDRVLSESWQCADLVQVNDGDSARLFVGGTGFSPVFDGQAVGLLNGSVLCRNLTQDVDVTVPLAPAGTWSCTGAGLPVERGDAVQAIVTGRAGSDDPGPRVSVDFESGEAVFLNFEGGVSLVVANPQPNAENPSEFAAQMQKFAGASFAGSTLVLDDAFPLGNGVFHRMKVLAAREVEVLFKLEPLGAVERTVAYSGSGDWEELCYDFSGEAGDFDGITLIFDNGVVGDAENDPDNWTFWFDDIEQSDVPCAVPFN